MKELLNPIIEFISSGALPIIVTTLAVLFTSFARMSVRRAVLYEDVKLDGRPSVTDNIKTLILREDTSLRVLEEIHRSVMADFPSFSGNDSATRISALRRIQIVLRGILSEFVKSDSFATIRDRVIALIDEANKEIEILQQRKPFDGLLEPEKSLLIDMLAEIPDDRKVPRQKAIQLADVIQLKHQEMLKLQQANARSAVWSRWGTYGTVFFGILSILLSVYTTIK